jgi:hypothetical protein
MDWKIKNYIKEIDGFVQGWVYIYIYVLGQVLDQ